MACLDSLKVFSGTIASFYLPTKVQLCIVHMVQRKLFPNNESAMKIIYLALTQLAKKWIMPIHNWRLAINHFKIELSERVEKYIH